MTQRIAGPDGASLSFEVPLQGLSTAAGHGASPPAADWLDILLKCALGADATVAGSNVSSSANGTITTASDTHNMTNMLCVYESGLNSSLAQWRHCESTSTPYNIHRNWTANPTAAAVSYGNRYWNAEPSNLDSAASLAAVVDIDGVYYTLLGGYVSSLKLTAPAGEIARLQFTLQFASKTEDTSGKSALPAITSGTFDGATPIVGELHEAEFNGTVYASAGVELDFGIVASHRAAVTSDNAVGGVFHGIPSPKLTLRPTWALALETAYRAGTAGNLCVRFGAGTLASSRINSFGLFAEAAQLESVASQDDSGLLRQSLTLAIVDGGQLSGSTYHPLFLFARA